MGEIYIPEAIRRRDNATLGSEKLIYFERVSDGRLIIPPVGWAPLPVCHVPKPHERSDDNCVCGYVKREADSAAALDKISRRYEAQKKSEWARIDENRCRIIEEYHKNLRSKLHAVINSAESSPLAKDLIRAALKKLEEGERNLRQRTISGNFSIEAG